MEVNRTKQYMAFVAAGDEAFAGLVDALDFTDVARDVGQLTARDFANSLSIGRYPSTLEALKGSAAISGVVLTEPLVKKAGRAIYRHFRKRGWHRTTPTAKKTAHSSIHTVTPDGKHRRIGPPLPNFFDYPTKPMPILYGPVRRRRRRYRKAPYKRRARKSKTAIASTKPTRVLKGSSYGGGRVHVVKKLLDGPAPTEQESTGSLGVVLLNVGSKSPPDGTFAFTYAFNLTQLPGYAQYTAIYQYYRILWVRMHFVPLQTGILAHAQGDATNPTKGASTTATSSSFLGTAPWMIFAKDEATSAIFTSGSEAMEHDGSSLHVFNDPSELSVYLSPKNHDLIGVAGTEVPIPVKTSTWIPTSSTAVKHYGLRCLMNNMTSSTQVRVWTEMKVAFKDLKA